MGLRVNMWSLGVELGGDEIKSEKSEKGSLGHTGGCAFIWGHADFLRRFALWSKGCCHLLYDLYGLCPGMIIQPL